LCRRAGVNYAPQAYPSVSGSAHGAMLTGGVHGGPSPLLRRQVGGRPARDGELRVLGLIAARNVIVILEERSAVGANQHRAKRCVASLQGLAGQLYAAPQMDEV